MRRNRKIPDFVDFERHRNVLLQGEKSADASARSWGLSAIASLPRARQFAESL